MKHQIVIAICALLIGAASALFAVRFLITSQPAPAFHEHADFALFLDGKQFDFAKDTYMSNVPCTVATSGWIDAALAHGGDSEHAEFVHLHDMVGSVVHVHKAGITWGNFFEALHMLFTDDLFVDENLVAYQNNDTHVFRFFVNGVEVTTLTDREIRDQDRVLITYGKRDRAPESIAAELGAVSNDACVPSGFCAHRGPAVQESCGAERPTTSVKLLQWLGVN